jgi:ketosteroid isomerase-like protein
VGRGLDERLALRAPGLFRQLVKLMLVLPPGWEVKRRLVKSFLARGAKALAREDYELVLLTYDRDVEIINIGDDALALGFAQRYHGHQGYLELMRLWRAAWLRPRYAPEAVTDLGDRFVVRIKLTGQGASSGAEVAQTCGCVLDFARGAVVRMHIYWDWCACVQALGLDNDRTYVGPTGA